MRADFDVYGVQVGLDGPAALLREVERCRPGCWTQGRHVSGAPTLEYRVLEGADGFDVERSGADVPLAVGVAEPLEAARHLVGDAHFEIACRSHRFLFLHAGSVGIGGRALLLPGRSRAGKSTLVGELVRRGATYLSDEYAVLGPDLLIHPYDRELALRGPHGHATPTPASALGAVGAAGPLPLGCVVSAHYVEGEVWAPEPVRGAQKIRPLFDNAVLAQAEGPALFDRLTRLLAGVEVWEGVRPDAAAVVTDHGWMLGLDSSAG